MSPAKENILGLVLFPLILFASVWGVLTVFSPDVYDAPLEISGEYDSLAMREALHPAAVDLLHEQIEALGPRMLGREGIEKAADFIAEHYTENGLELHTLEGEVAAPVTQERNIRLAGGGSMDGVEVYPFPPNSFQPVVTTPDGLVGELVLLDGTTLLERSDFSDAIGVLRLDMIPRIQGLEWSRYAQMGMKGLILTHPDGLEAMPWQKILSSSGMQSILPINFPRLAASGALLDYVGEEVRIEVNSRFEPTTHRTLVGVLRAEEPKAEALVLNVAYDQYGLLPDYAVNPLQSFPLAVHLALVKGMAAHRDELQRDVIFVATSAQYIAFAGLDHLLRMVGPEQSRSAARDRIERQIEAEEGGLARAARLAALVEAPGFLEEAEATLEAEKTLSKNDRRFLTEELRYVLNTKVFNFSEKVLQKRIEFERGDVFELNRPEYKEFLDAQFVYEDFATAASLSLSRLFEKIAVGFDEKTRFTDAYDLRGALRKRFETLRSYHEKELEILKDGLELNRLFAGYEELYVVSAAFLPSAQPKGTDQVSLILGGPSEVYERATSILSNELFSLVEGVIQQANLKETVELKTSVGKTAQNLYSSVSSYPIPTSNWNAMGYRAFTFINTDRLPTYQNLRNPVLETPPSASGMVPSLAFTGEFALALGKGFGKVNLPPQIQPYQYSGNVYVSDVGRSLVPNYPLAGALVGPKSSVGSLKRSPDRYEGMLHFTNPYGTYDLPDTSSLFQLGNDYNLQAVYYDSEGFITYIKDESASTQDLFTSIYRHPLTQDFRNINLVAFRGSPVAILDMINPQTLRPFSSIQLIRAGSLTDFKATNKVTTPDSSVTFIPPDSYFYTTFRSGTPENELVQVVRSYMSGEAPGNPEMEDAVSGQGYLAIDQDIIPNVAFEQARSMHRLNDTRLELQEAKGLADRHTLEFHEQSERLLETAADPEKSPSFFQRILTARDSLTYSIIIHPILRQNINDAVVSILWYMALLIPFMFFFEKLLFGFSDIRKQLAAQILIFLVVFMLLRYLHPAFEMIRSSIMILLGFFILMISIAMTFLFAGKFRENLEEIKQRRGKLTAAEANSFGILGTAFMLGLNNMHRRKVRTGLTCLTLVLITFAMICFTSIYSDFEDSEVALAPAAYQGLLVKNEKYTPISETERFAINSRYGFKYPVAARTMYVGRTSKSNERLNPKLEITHRASDDRTYSRNFGSIVQFAHNEPLRGGIPLITDPYWFEASETADQEEPIPVIVPQSMAERLGITVPSVNEGGVPVRINGGEFIVRGIFDEAGYRALQDLDGRPILPFDVRGLPEVEGVPGAYLSVLGDEDGVLIAPSDIILAPQADLGILVADADRRLVSLALDFGSLNLREAREEIHRFLEQRARPAFYGVDGTAYRGSRMRVSSFAGLVDLIIPLIIAALTVLNTMKGSVYERRDEIYVYNAVGIAPRFIFFMFFAEAFVYAVVGCVLGYLLSQGTGTLLTALDLTGGMNMTFASVNSIYASLAVVGAVFISTYFPARSAMEIAAPAEEAGWDMPEPTEDTFEFNLPFTFSRRERIAVLAFFYRFLADHGEGGSGSFASGPPRYEIEGSTDGGPEAVIPSVCATIWLKPYDLGVSQEITIETPLDEETGDFIAAIRMVRASGTKESWQRVNRSFLVGIRRQFLYWRAISPEIKTELYEEARHQMEAKFTAEPKLHG